MSAERNGCVSSSLFSLYLPLTLSSLTQASYGEGVGAYLNVTLGAWWMIDSFVLYVRCFLSSPDDRY